MTVFLAEDSTTITTRVKETLMIQDVPVIMFSSLINDQISRKCQAVGADDFLSKPQFAELIELLDSYCLSKESQRP